MREWLPHTTCHMSCVRLHMSHVIYLVSGVKCHVSCVYFVEEASRWRVGYQRGLTRQVHDALPKKNVEVIVLLIGYCSLNVKFRHFK